MSKITFPPVTERDLRAPEFRQGEPNEYEFREDGTIARKDRWEQGIRQLAAMFFTNRESWEVNDVVSKVLKLVEEKYDDHGELITDKDDDTDE